jgi:hypothetical protein
MTRIRRKVKIKRMEMKIRKKRVVRRKTKTRKRRRKMNPRIPNQLSSKVPPPSPSCPDFFVRD